LRTFLRSWKKWLENTYLNEEIRQFLKMMKEDFTRYEKARILGARALQISMNAPLLIKISEEDLERINYDALKIAEIELESGILPISVKKPFPIKKEEELKKAKEVKEEKEAKVSEAKKGVMESEEESEISKEGEIMALANPEDESEEESEEEGEE
jgi:DNA-directed RNA polymerase subunit K